MADRVARAGAVFAALGIVDFLISSGRIEDAGLLDRVGAGIASVGAWTLAGFVWAVASSVVIRLVLGSSTTERAASWSRGMPRRVWVERHEHVDVARGAALLAGIVGIAAFAAASVAFIAYLVATRHGALLIALTAVTAQAAILVVAAAISFVTFRLTHAGLGRMRRSSAGRRINAPTIILALMVVVLAGFALVLVAAWETVVQVEGIAILLGLVAVCSEAALTLWRPRRTRPSAWVVVIPLFALGALVVPVQADGAYAGLLQTDAAKHLAHALGALSDLDADGSPVLPRFADCRPFDATISPLASEIPNNGIDENCDGKDSARAIGEYPLSTYRLPYSGKPNLVLITFDALRADHLGFMGYERNTSPNLDRMAKAGVVFEHAFSQDSGTAPSFWSLTAGKTPFQVKFGNKKWPPRLHASENPLAELLEKQGYVTHWLMCGSVGSLERGFTKAENICPSSADKKPAAERAVNAALAALEELRAGDRPFFLWTHLFDPHEPYMHYRTRSFGRSNMDKYDEAIAYADEHFGRLYDRVMETSGSRPLFVAVGADHGENFREHGTAPHARTLYREVTNVPLMFAGTGVKSRRVSELAALNDIYPTFLELARVTVPKDCSMRSQVPVLFGEPADPARVVFQENSFSRPQRHVRGALLGSYHYLMDLTTGVDEMYDYRADPKEKRNLIGKGLREEEELRAILKEFLTTSQYPSWMKG